MYFRLTTLKIPPPNVISHKKNCNCFRLWAPPMILLTAGALTDPQLPAKASNVYTTDARPGGIDQVASTGWHRPGAPPNKNPGYAGVLAAYSSSCGVSVHNHLVHCGPNRLDPDCTSVNLTLTVPRSRTKRYVDRCFPKAAAWNNLPANIRDINSIAACQCGCSELHPESHSSVVLLVQPGSPCQNTADLHASPGIPCS